MKKLFTVLLAALLALTLAVPTFATEVTESQITADIVGYSDARVEKKDLSAVPSILTFDPTAEGKEYVISTPTELSLFTMLSLSNDFAGYTIYLGGDIDMAGITDFKPIGGGIKSENSNKAFAGTFDGQGFTIDNLVMDAGIAADETADGGFWGLFSVVKGATIKNVILGEGCTITQYGKHNRVAGIVAMISGTTATTIDNCWNKGDISGQRFVSGIVGQAYLSSGANDNLDENIKTVVHTVSNCTNSGDIVANQNDVGGVVGYIASMINITNCRNTGSVTSKNDTTGKSTGGIVGRNGATAAPTGGTISGCINNGAISGKSDVGGIIGNTSVAITVEKCHNYGTITSQAEASANVFGPIVGRIVNDVTVTTTDNVDHVANNETDASLEVALKADILISGTVVTPPDVGGNNSEGDNNSDNSGSNDDNNNNNNNSNDHSDTTPAQTEENTEAPNDEEKSGCASVVSASFAVLGVLMGAGAMLCKKRR